MSQRVVAGDACGAAGDQAAGDMRREPLGEVFPVTPGDTAPGSPPG